MFSTKTVTDPDAEHTGYSLNKYFSERYGDKFHKIEIFNLDSPPTQLLPDLKIYRDTTQKVNNKLYGNIIHYGYPLRDNILISFAV